ncbi:hypothetical protein ACH8ZP_02340 [Chlamydia pneumoniae]|uniref:Putative membrane protein n=1 Tax=Chlamydia pneumoniae TaxID=83558 RepID=Q9Z877_CHLPN|nr:hypothetical protein [Chlamydia pneumoniae]AAD18614.1 CT365 hypothetical protein [Chlamydia pneumoniae CWL029]AAF38138.1 conserved hypothetical protein [Chlamydia pneumoniae AR39]CRI32983.1 Putative membrane protein [Chlamydia pneumoniae]CRI35846.1 Putative membrane protein [Chlamydia pneumoniae]CRI36973.1 Putative membrane protein [Chlamydia pneumoniae]
MSTSPISNDPRYLSLSNATEKTSLLANSRSLSPVPNSLVPSNPEDTGLRKSIFTHSVTLFAGLVVLLVAVSVVVVALTVLAPGVPQAILLGIAISGVGIGGFSIMKSLVYMVRDYMSPRMQESSRIKSALAVGTGFTVMGLVMKVGANFVPGGYGGLVGSLGSSAYSRGSQTTLASFSHYIYTKFFRSEKVAKGEKLTEAETIKEAKKLHYITLSIATIGVGLAVLGILLAIAGTVLLGGAPATIAIILAPPLISIGLTTVLQTILHSSIGKWRAFLLTQEKKDLFVDTSLKDIRLEKLPPSEVEESETSQSVIEVPDSEGIAETRISAEEIDTRLSLTTRQKVIFALATLLLLASIAAFIVTGFGGLTVMQVLLVASVGSAVASVTLPMVSSGFSYVAYQLKARLNISKLRWKEAKNKKRVRQFLIESGVIASDREFNQMWKTVYKKQIQKTDAAIREEVRNFEKGGEVNSALVGGILLGVGTGIMLLALVPAFAPIVPGILALGGSTLGIAGSILMRKFVNWLYDELVKLYERRRNRRELLYGPESKMRSIATDLVVEALAASHDHLFDLDGPVDFIDVDVDIDGAA